MCSLLVLYAEKHGDKKEAGEEDKSVWRDANDDALALWSETVCEDAEDLWTASSRSIIARAAGDRTFRQTISRIWNVDNKYK